MTSRVKTFAARLHEVCTDELRLPVGWGRESALGKRFGVTPNAAGKWLRGEGYPKMDCLIEICHAAGVSLNWLTMGVGPRKISSQSALATAVSRAIEALPPSAGVEVGDFVRYKLQQAETTGVSEPVKHYIAEVTDGIKQAQLGR